MTSQEARQILLTCRAGVDWQEPAFHEALAQAKCDPELASWLREQGAIYEAVRKGLKDVPVPEDLAGKILARHSRRKSGRPILQLAAALLALLAVAAFWMNGRSHPPAFAEYRASMTKLVSRKYPMGLETSDLERVRKFLANNQSPSDYVLPPALHGTPLLGCATLSWGANPVSLLCFRRADGHDVWLFITGHRELAGAPSASAPVLAESNSLTTASWESDGRIYLLASRGGPDELRPYLE